MATNDGGPAFPATVAGDGDEAWPCHADTANGFLEDAHEAPGMSLRDYFAAKAMSGILAGVNSRLACGADEAMVAKDAYAIADSMLAARGQQ